MDLTDLRALTKNLGGESSIATSGQLYDTPDVDQHLNMALNELWQEAKMVNSGWGAKSTIINTVAGQPNYPLPADFAGRIILARMATSGTDLNAGPLTPQNQAPLKPSEMHGPLSSAEAYLAGQLTETIFFAFEGMVAVGPEVHIYAPPKVTQTGGLYVEYDAMATELVDAADVPEIPLPHHDLLCFMAAKTLKGTKDLQFPFELEATRQKKMSQFMETFVETIYNPEFRPPSAGLRPKRNAIRMGRVTKRRIFGTSVE